MYIPSTSLATLDPYWVRELELRENDKEIICSGHWLTDKHISAMNKLLRRQYPQQNGLMDTICLSEQSVWKAKTHNFIQVHNISGSHWVCTSNIECNQNSVNVYDSMPICSIESMSLKKQLAAILQTDANTFEVNFINVQRQIGTDDCGLFGIAHATLLCFGSDPYLLKYDQRQMRDHLYNCYEKRSMTPFPQKGVPPRANRQRVLTTLSIPVYCSCRMPYSSRDSRMIQCASCSEWFHDSCIPVIPNEYWTTRKNWICNKC